MMTALLLLPLLAAFVISLERGAAVECVDAAIQKVCRRELGLGQYPKHYVLRDRRFGGFELTARKDEHEPDHLALSLRIVL